MPTLIIPGAFQATLHGTSGGLKVENVLGFMETTGGTSAALGAAINAAFKRSGGPYSVLNSQYTYLGCTVTDLSTASGSVANVADNVPGYITGQIATAGACALVQLTSGTRARSRNGRIYHGPLSESQIASNGRTLDTGVAQAITNAWNQFFNDVAAAGFPFGVISRKNSYITGLQLVRTSATIATQRRRIRG